MDRDRTAEINWSNVDAVAIAKTQLLSYIEILSSLGPHVILTRLTFNSDLSDGMT